MLMASLASATVPLYQGEITAPHIRGRMISLQQVRNYLPTVDSSITLLLE